MKAFFNRHAVSTTRSLQVMAVILAVLIVSPGTAAVSDSAKRLDSLREAYLEMQFGMFLHFNMSTFTDMTSYSPGREWASPNADEDNFAPSRLDCGQWADAAVAAKMKYMILVAKHHDGFCLWPSEYSTHTVKESKWRDGKGDVVREYVDSARSRGIKVGIYFSIWDGYNNFCTKNGCDSNFVKNQISELLTNYGPIECLWFDRWGWNANKTTGEGGSKNDVNLYDLKYSTVHNAIKSIQPNCLIVNNSHMKPGSDGTTYFTEVYAQEGGRSGPPETNKAAYEWAITVRQAEMTGADNCWFYKPKNNCRILNATKIATYTRRANSRHANFLLNVTIDTSGTLPECQYDTLRKVGTLLDDYTAPIPPTPVRRQLIAPVVSDGISISHATGSVLVQCAKGKSLTVTLLDLRGKVIRRVLGVGTASVPTRTLGAGTYLVSIAHNGRTAVYPIAIAR